MKSFLFTLFVIGLVIIGPIALEFTTSTVASDFTEEKFESISSGMSEREVINILGAPVNIIEVIEGGTKCYPYIDISGGTIAYEYGKGRFTQCNFFRRKLIILEDDIVVGKHDYYW